MTGREWVTVTAPLVAEPTRGSRWSVTFSECHYCHGNIARNPSTGQWEHVTFGGLVDCEDS